jgi:hypothetical protein
MQKISDEEGKHRASVSEKKWKPRIRQAVTHTMLLLLSQVQSRRCDEELGSFRFHLDCVRGRRGALISDLVAGINPPGALKGSLAPAVQLPLQTLPVSARQKFVPVCFSCLELTSSAF